MPYPESGGSFITCTRSISVTFRIEHHGATGGVTGSCHELCFDGHHSVLIDCGLFQGTEVSLQGAGSEALEIEFPVDHVKALLVTHVHIDHVGRIPYLLAAGFRGPIFCTEPSALLLPLVLEDAVKVGFTRNECLLDRFLKHLKRQIIPVPYGHWRSVDTDGSEPLRVKFKPAGHILGSAYIECRFGRGRSARKVIFSGDLGAPYAPLLPAPRAPYSADTVVLESTYGDRNHEDRRLRHRRLKAIIEQGLRDSGVVLIPAFSIGRTQELLYELEHIIHQYGGDGLALRSKYGRELHWEDLEIIIDSPLASRFTAAYRQLKSYWDAEARRCLAQGRHPLSFEQLTTIDTHEDHRRTVAYLQKTARPCIVIAANGMCNGGRIVNYLKALIEEPHHDILFVGYQARGTPGRMIQKYGPRHGYVDLDEQRYTIRAHVHTLSGYSAHAGQQDLVNFIKRMRHPPR